MLTLLHKEFLDFWRSKKFIWLPVVFMLFCVMQPLTYYFMDDILKFGGNLPEGAVIEMPLPSSAEVMASVLSQLNTVGVLLMIVATMGSINDEQKNGSLTLLLVRPIFYINYVSSKIISQSVLLIFSFLCGYALSYYYTIVLFSSVAIDVVLQSALIYSLYVFFIVTIVIFTSALLNNSGAIAIVNVLFLGGLSIVSSWLTEILKYSPTRLSSFASAIVMNEETNGLVGCVIVTLCVTVALHIGTAMIVKKKRG